MRQAVEQAYAHFGSLDRVEQLIPLVQSAGLPLTHLAMAFVTARPNVTSAIIGPRTMPHLDDLLTGAAVILEDAVLDQIDKIVPPGDDIAPLGGAAYNPPAMTQTSLRRPAAERAAA